jgi:hypothetical protein
MKGTVKELRGAAPSADSVLLYEVCNVTQGQQVVQAFNVNSYQIKPPNIIISNTDALQDLGKARYYDPATVRQSWPHRALKLSYKMFKRPQK